MINSKSLKILIPYLFLLPAGIILILFFFIPFFESFILSFQSYRHDIYNPQWVGPDNYIKLFSTPVFWETLLNTFIYVIVVVPALVVLPLVIAIAVSRKLAGIGIFRTIIYIPVVVSLVVAGIAWKWVYAPTGWLANPGTSLFAVMFVTIWKGLGYYMVIYLAYLTTMPKDLWDAAEIDGAGTVQKHLSVTVPHMMPAIALVSIISTISAMKVFVEIYVMTKGGPLNSSKTIVYYIYQKAFENLDLGYASAAGVILLVIIMLISIFNMKFFERGNYSC